MKVNKIVSYAVALSAVMVLVGCGSDNNGSTTKPLVNAGYYVDSALSGVDYSCGKFHGITDSSGKFNFEVGKECVFSVGGVTLRDVQANKLKQGVTIVENNITVATFLQTLDNDGNASNGIEILPEVANAIKGMGKVPSGDVDLSNMMSTIAGSVTNYSGRLVTEKQAEKHLKSTEKSVTEELLKNRTFYIVFDDASSVYKLKIDANVTEAISGTTDDSYSVSTKISLDGNSIVWPDGKTSEVKGYTSNHITFINHYSDGTFNYSYLFQNVDDANTFATQLINSTERTDTSGSGLVQVVAPADPSSLDLASYNVLIFYKNTSYSKYNYYAKAPDKLVSLLTKSVNCLDYNFTTSQKVQDTTQEGVVTTTYFNANKHRTCIESDYASAKDANLSGEMKFVVYYSR